MWILQRFKNPLILIIGKILKIIIRRSFFSKIENKDFNNLITIILDSLPNETIISIFQLLGNAYNSKPSELFKIKIFNDAMIHSLPLASRAEIAQQETKKIKYLFIILILGNVLKRWLFLTKTIIILPFQLGVYSFMAYLFGIKVDWLLSIFDIFKFNLPSWTYHKLLELHISWLNWIKTTLQITSITTEENPSKYLPKIKKSIDNLNSEIEPIHEEHKPGTFLTLTKKEWLIVSISTIFLLGAYFGYTGGIPFTKSFEWDNSSGDSDQGDLKGKSSLKETNINPRGLESPISDNNKTWQDTFMGWASKIKDKINPFSWFTKTSDDQGTSSYRFWAKNETESEKRWEKILSQESLDVRLRHEQLERNGVLNELDRELERQEYNNNSKNTTSPTHSDPEVTREYNKLFPKPTSSSNTNSINQYLENVKSYTDKIREQLAETKAVKKELEESNRLVEESNKILQEGEPEIKGRDSSETIRPESISSENRNNSPINSQDNLDSDVEGETHTYPPRRFNSKWSSRFSQLAHYPFAYGYSDDLDHTKTNKTPTASSSSSSSSSSISSTNTESKAEVAKDSLLSSRFLDNFNDEWKD